MENIYWNIFETRLGKCLIAEGKNGIIATTLPSTREEDIFERLRELQTISYVRKDTPLLTDAGNQLKDYFDGKRTSFHLPLDLRGTPFQLKIWSALQKIPYGVTWSYQDLANTIGSPKAVRAVGAANGRNPIPVIVPCHRVIGKNGSLTGFTGGIALKKSLLDLEASFLAIRSNPRSEVSLFEPVSGQVAP